MAEGTNTTVGGANVGGNASAGGDFAGRDRYSRGDGSSSSQVDIFTGEYRHSSGYTSEQILDNLQKAVLGDPYNPSQPGILRSLAELSASMAAFHSWRAAADVERANLGRDIQAHQDRTDQRLQTTDSRLAAMMAIVWFTVAIVGVEAIAIILLFVQRSAAVIGG